jgi:Holliday junction resolvase RusA-like endonuclease
MFVMPGGKPLFECVIESEPASKSNSRRLVYFAGRSRVIKSAKALGFERHIRQHIKPIDPLLQGDLLIVMQIFYQTRRPDLDESLILDALQGIAYTNDRQIKQKLIFWGLDKVRPRAHVRIYPVVPESGGAGH